MYNASTRIWTVEKGDTLNKIAQTIYTDPLKAPLIEKANKSLIENPKKLDIGLQLTIPSINKDTQARTEVKGNKEANILLTIDGKAVNFVNAIKFGGGQNSAARRLAFTIPFEAAAAARVFSNVEFYVNNVLYIKGYLIMPDIIYEKGSGHLISWQCTSKIYPVIHSHFKATSNDAASWRNITLKTLFDKILSPYGLNLIIKDAGIGLEKFEKIGFEDDETKFAFLKRIANQKKYSLNGLATGDLLLYQVNTRSAIVGKFNDASRMAASYNYEGLGNEYRATNQKKGSGAAETATNQFIPFEIFKNLKQDSSNDGDLKKFANYTQSSLFAESLSLSIETDTIFNDAGDLFDAGDLISIQAKELDFPDDTTFAVDSPEFSMDEGGTRAVLTCVLPELRKGEMPERLPFL